MAERLGGEGVLQRLGCDQGSRDRHCKR
jgi:hypothetical protein